MSVPRPSTSDQSPAIRDAMILLQAGKGVEAEETMLRAAEEARLRFGAGSHADAVARTELGSVLLNAGQLERAIDAFRESVSGEMPSDPQHLRDRLTFLMSLGQALTMAKRFEEAEEVLHKGLEGRLSFYGREHAGYAFGLEPLAEVTLRVGKKETALEMIDEVIHNFWRNSHTRVAGAIVIRAEMLKEADKPGASFAGLEKLPKEVIDEVGKQGLARVGRSTNLKISRQVLGDLTALLADRLGESHPTTVNALITISNIERKLGAESDRVIRESAIRRVIAIFDSQHRGSETLQAILGLALAQSDAGQGDQAIETYCLAVDRANKSGDASEKSQVLRNYGLLLADLERDAEAAPLLRQSVAELEDSQNAEMLAQSLIALGIFLHHGEQFEEAGSLLRRALPMLDPAHPDAITCRSHLRAIEIGGSCGCGDTSDAVAEAFSEFVMARIPAGLVKKLNVTLDEGHDFSIGVQLEGTPGDEELSHLDRVLQHAAEEFRHKIARP